MVPDSLSLHLEDIYESCPLQAGPIYTAYKDLALSVEWRDLRAFEIPGSGWATIIGHKRPMDPLRVVLPLPLHTTALKPSSLKSIFTALSSLPISSIPEPFPPLVPAIEELRWQLSNGQSGNKEATKGQAEPQPSGKADSEAIFPEVIELDRQMIYIAIVTSDSTVVYYKLSKGIKKPADIPDE